MSTKKIIFDKCNITAIIVVWTDSFKKQFLSIIIHSAYMYIENKSEGQNCQSVNLQNSFC